MKIARQVTRTLENSTIQSWKKNMNSRADNILWGLAPQFEHATLTIKDTTARTIHELSVSIGPVAECYCLNYSLYGCLWLSM
jgi:hypothetical protein